MGNFFGRLSRVFGGSKEIRLLMLGLDGAGKTTILCYLKSGIFTLVVPTVGFNVESVSFKHVRFDIWDVGGQSHIRPLWRHYFTGAQALVFVIDSGAPDRILEAKEEFLRIVNDPEMANISVLLYANKQDVTNSQTPKEITETLQLTKCLKGRKWMVQPCVAKTGEGVEEGMRWLKENV
ncbi:ADP-ribosylation factor family-domain-containing protein [Lipomyces oligophaga]|uniref:ADP-ribosylation factor family-domain-containing protein n=1 Tax=Lipomyces oligophaga TaxID=45792 RepID=UPI0034CE4D04